MPLNRFIFDHNASERYRVGRTFLTFQKVCQRADLISAKFIWAYCQIFLKMGLYYKIGVRKNAERKETEQVTNLLVSSASKGRFLGFIYYINFILTSLEERMLMKRKNSSGSAVAEEEEVFLRIRFRIYYWNV